MALTMERLMNYFAKGEGYPYPNLNELNILERVGDSIVVKTIIENENSLNLYQYGPFKGEDVQELASQEGYPMEEALQIVMESADIKCKYSEDYSGEEFVSTILEEVNDLNSMMNNPTEPVDFYSTTVEFMKGNEARRYFFS